MREGTIGHRQWNKSIIESQGYTRQREHVTCYVLVGLHILGPASEMKEMNQKEDFSSFKYINLLIDIGEMMIVYRVALEGDIFGFSALYSSDFSLFLVLGGCSS